LRRKRPNPQYMATWDTPASSNDIALTGNLEGCPSILSLVLFYFLSVTHTNRCMLELIWAL